MALAEAGKQPKPRPEGAVATVVGEGNLINKSKGPAGLVHRSQRALGPWYIFIEMPLPSQAHVFGHLTLASGTVLGDFLAGIMEIRKVTNGIYLPK